MPRDILKEARRIALHTYSSEDAQDSMFDEAVQLMAKHDVASAALLQRRLSLGYARAARLLDQLEEAGVIGPAEGSKPREVLISSYEDYTNRSFKKPHVAPEESDPDWNSYESPNWKSVLTQSSSIQLFEAISKSSSTSPLSFPLGWEKESLKITTLSDTPHCIITGSPHSRKLEFIDTMLLSLIAFSSPTQLRIVLHDGAHYLSPYNGIPHLLTPVTAEPDKALAALRWGEMEMESRWSEFSKANCRDIDSYNKASSNPMSHILYIITQIDECMSYAKNEITEELKKLTSQGFRAGIHIVLVSDSLASRSIPKEIRENIPNVISFKSTWDGSSKPKDSEGLTPNELLYKNDEDNTVTTLDAPFLEESEVLGILKEIKKV